MLRAAQGFGFITSDDGSDVFCHQTAIQSSGYRYLNEGERVSVAAARRGVVCGWRRLVVVRLAASSASGS